MNKSTKLILILWAVMMMTVYAQTIKPNAVGLRGGPYHMNDQSAHIIVSHHYDNDEVYIGGFSGWIYLYSQLQDNLYFDLSIGSIARVEEKSSLFHEELVEVYTVNPLLFGIHYDLLSAEHPGRLRPYASIGGGPYWISKVKVEENYLYDEVNIGTDLKGGAYLGSGINFPVSGRIAFNFDMKYHFIDFDPDNNFSGFEYGIGLHFMWGQSK